MGGEPYANSRRSDIVRVTTRCWYPSHLVSDSFQLLHKASAQTTPSIFLVDLHGDIAIRMIIMKQEASGAHPLCIQLQEPLALACTRLKATHGFFFRSYTCQRRTLSRPGRRQLITKDDFLACRVITVRMEHHRQQTIASLHFKKPGATCSNKPFKKVERPSAPFGQHIEFENRWFVLPRSANGDGTKADDATPGLK